MGGSEIARGCDADLMLRVDPISKTLRLGEAFTPDAVALGCSGGKKLSQSWSWATTDATVLRVDATTGRTTAAALGAATLNATGSPYQGEVQVAVTVIP